ncbi:hypothetical protein BJF79_07640 [Actinomadura sp. CNU-125]|nr:hypothetical protein BJF79_07640 [Actinomadura sp. CNU-125]
MNRLLGLTMLCAAVLVSGTGCAGVPSGGQVVTGMPAERAERVDDPYVRLVPVEPDPEWGPAEIVSGFLAASAGFDDDHRVAKEYLGAKTRWDPGPRPFVTVLADRIIAPQVVQAEGGQATVRITGEQLGTITSDGQYTAAPKDLDVTFQLARTAQGPWRITGLPGGDKAGLILSKDDVERAMRTVNLYFFAPDRHTLVPNGIFLPVVNRQTLPTQLVRALLSGPTSWLNGAVRSAFPAGTELRGPVAIDNDVATVDLTEAAHGGDIERMSAQLGWTLRQLSEIQRWRLRIDGETVTADGMGSTQSVYAWPENSPDGPDAKDKGHQNAYLVGESGALGTLRGDRPHPVAATVGHLSRPAVSPDYGEVAGLSQARDRLVVAAPVTNAAVPRVLLTPATAPASPHRPGAPTARCGRWRARPRGPTCGCAARARGPSAPPTGASADARSSPSTSPATGSAPP